MRKGKREKTIFLSVLALCALLGVAQAQEVIRGYLLFEYYDNVAGTTVDDLLNAASFPNDASLVEWRESFEGPLNRADNYGIRAGGWLIPPETGTYTFWISSDDASQLWLSPDDDPETAILTAEVPGWANPREWTKYPEQQSAPIALVADTRYYIEVLMKEGGGGDNLAVGWTGPGIADGNTLTVIEGQYLSPYITGDDDPLIAQFYQARLPMPADTGLAGSTRPVLGWAPVIYAGAYQVYLGLDADAVAAGDASVDQGQVSEPSFATQTLNTNTTYYWRVDGLGADGTVYAGDVWSFTVVSKSASLPSPPNAVLFVDPNADLSWTPGLGAVQHQLYLGTNVDEVLAGAESANRGLLTEPTFDPGTLERGASYYWRVDELDGTETHRGPLWQFQIEYDLTIGDPNLIGWWRFEEGAASAIDWSGYGHHGTIQGDPEWVPGEDGMALDFDGVGDYVDTGLLPSDLGVGGNAPRTAAAWMFVRSFNGGAPYEMGSHSTAEDFSLTTRPTVNEWRLQYWNADVDFEMEALDEWLHVTQTHDGSETRIYANGTLLVTHPVTLNTTDGKTFKIGAYRSNFFDGILDDVRLYNRAVTAEDVAQIMRGSLAKAWAPVPTRGAQVDIEAAATLSFSAGDNALMHDIYLGTDAAAVAAAVADADVSPAYQGRQADTSLAIGDQVAIGETYYWRVDEIDADGVVTPGSVWSFSITEYLIVDDFESYDDGENRVFQTWKDGFGFSEPEPGYEGNGTGSAVGNTVAPFMELTNVNSGAQAVPFFYDNSGGFASAYSEMVREFETAQDMTRRGVTELSVAFVGDVFNAAAPLYVALEDGSGAVAVVVHSDPEAVMLTDWQAWRIALSDFSGVDLQDIVKVYIGVGDRNAPSAGGSGRLNIDDIRLYP